MSRESKIVLTVAVVLLLVFGIGLIASANGPDNITICHAAGQEGTTHFETLELPPSAVFPNSQGNGGHFFENGTPRAGHEQDYFGACIPTTTTTIPTTTTEAPTTTVNEETTTTGPGSESTTTSVITSSTLDTTTTTESPSTTSGSDTPTTSGTPPTTTTRDPSDPDELPFTGLSWYAWAGMGLALVGSGVFLVRRSKTA